MYVSAYLGDGRLLGVVLHVNVYGKLHAPLHYPGTDPKQLRRRPVSFAGIKRRPDPLCRKYREPTYFSNSKNFQFEKRVPIVSIKKYAYLKLRRRENISQVNAYG